MVKVFTQEMSPIKSLDFVRGLKEAIAHGYVAGYTPFHFSIAQSNTSAVVYSQPAESTLYITNVTIAGGTGANATSVYAIIENSVGTNLYRLPFLELPANSCEAVCQNFDVPYILYPTEQVLFSNVGAGCTASLSISGYLVLNP